MLKSLASFLVLAMLGFTSPAQVKAPSPKQVLSAKNGNVTFDHAAHAKREKNSCKACHPTPFAQDAKAPVGFKPPHKVAEDKKTSCGSCHRAGGTAFETKNNCAKCHVRAGAKG